MKTSILKQSIEDIVIQTADKMKDPKKVKEISSSKANSVTIEGKDIIPWGDTSLSHGYPGICILFGELDYMFPNDGWDRVGLEYLKAIRNDIEQNGIYSISTFSGLAGVGFAARSLSRHGTRYHNFIEKINKQLLKQLRMHLSMFQKEDYHLRMSDYDVIEGLSGVGRYLLFFKEDAEMHAALLEVLSYLVHLTEDIEVEGKRVPGWFIPSKNLFLEEERQLNPIGYFNCGLSHGIPGPLALLSIAYKEGVYVKGQKEAIKKISNWLISKVIRSSKGKYFPTVVSWDEQISRKVYVSVSRDAWCYGTPGVARALYLAGEAIDYKRFSHVAKETFNDIFTARTTEDWDIYSPTFCHGLSGLLQITMMMNEEKYVSKLVDYTLSFYDDEHPFGFQDVESTESGLKHLNKAGFLDGAAAILLTLLYYNNKKSYTDWEALFLLR